MFGGGDFQNEVDFIISSILESTLEEYGLKNETVVVGSIGFETEEQFERFMDLYIDLEDASRVWMNGGFTANEMERHITDGAYFFDDEIEDEEIDSGNIISLDAFRRIWEEE